MGGTRRTSLDGLPEFARTVTRIKRLMGGTPGGPETHVRLSDPATVPVETSLAEIEAWLRALNPILVGMTEAHQADRAALFRLRAQRAEVRAFLGTGPGTAD
ncbi:hypothetical protein ACTD5D_40360 [Nocardia takedensis]|uniref:hypothetical protein n=1 Tax=Nocardia takedensis TaxID=259390 RepID=UPI003F76A04A